MEHGKKQVILWSIATAITAAICGALIFVITLSFVIGEDGKKGMAAGIAAACVLFGFILHLVIYKLYLESRTSKPVELAPIPDIEVEKHASGEPTKPTASVTMEIANMGDVETDGTKLYMTVRTQAVLGTDRLAILKKKVRKVEAITQDEADKIIGLFLSEEHGIAAYELMKEKIITRETERTKKAKKKQRVSCCSDSDAGVEEKVAPSDQGDVLV